MNKKKLALFILLIVLVAAVIWSLFSTPRLKTANNQKPSSAQSQKTSKPSAAASNTANNAAKSSSKALLSVEDRTLRLDLLERVQSGFKGYRRNLFKPIFTDEIKFMKQKSVATKPLVVPPVAVVAVKPPPVQPETQAEIHKKALAKFTFLGFLKKDNRKTIFLAKDNDILLVKKGEVFAKLYEATSITDLAMTIRVIASGDEIVIPLNENKPLAADKKTPNGKKPPAAARRR